jgi:hypothetical protein
MLEMTLRSDGYALFTAAIETCTYHPDRSKRFEVIVQSFREMDEEGGCERKTPTSGS